MGPSYHKDGSRKVPTTALCSFVDQLNKYRHPPGQRAQARPPEDRPFGHYANSLAAPERSLTVINRQLHGLLTPPTRRKLDSLSTTVTLFHQGHPDMVFYTEEDAHGGTMLCATISDLTAQLRQTLWRQERPAILTYAAMSAVKERLPGHGLRYPLFTMGRSAIHTRSQFKASPGSVLLAAGAAWEGFDFPGDCVSLLIIPRPPFAVPDALMEKERENHPNLQLFIRAVAVPEMQIKLMQGFGRAIRTETDTCVVAILDERAAEGKRYIKDVLAALPEMPVTGSLEDVARFIRSVKDSDYFMEAAS